MQFHGKRVVILGLARQGIALARYLAGQGARVTVSDAKPAEALSAGLTALAEYGRINASAPPIEYVLGGHPPILLDGADLLCLSGGVSADLPLAWEARRRGIPLSNDSQIFLEATPARVVGITGSAGKTTTTTLVGLMAGSGWPRADGGGQPTAIGNQPSAISQRVWVGGNVGNPLLADLGEMRPGDLAVMELSSFQLEIMTVSPHVAAVLNITPNHLDRHGTMEAYAEAKSHILRHQSSGGVAVLGLDDPGAKGLAALVRGRLVWFSRQAEVSDGAFLRSEAVMLRTDGREHKVCDVAEIRVRGRHNVLNVLAACATSGAAGVPPEAMRQAIGEFTGVEHRLEFVREWNGVKWYNDSIATAPERAVAAILSFHEPIVLLAGGRDKKLPWDEFAVLVRERVKHLIVFGEARGLIESAVRSEGYAAITLRERMADAVTAAARIAQSGDVVLLAPGGTSFDEFVDFAERGVKFREMVKAL
ncbi:MAG: UDP-N-acetylmuramoyl-L-alanine--D-glutamate ligase [Chloroflexi bacterium]|nr:UDP-N-acetylmuramoyl-L-alanine--D-glutamate ligase [Chloroflexota bacterium]